MKNNTIDALTKHAKRFGTDGIAATAVELGVTSETGLALLIRRLDKIEDDAEAARRFHRPKKRRITAEVRARRLLGLEEPQEGKEE